jgi:hypothetical protein
MTQKRFSLVVALSIAGCLGACAQVTGSARTPNHATKEMRRAAIRQAQVWKATDVPSMDIRSGPQGPGAFAPNETVTCDYRNKEMTGATPKFTCVRPPNDELKVKYGRNNGEVFAEVAASRLFWALGFAAEHMYPVRVICRGCPEGIHGTEIASIQRKSPGKDIETGEVSGWSWSELDQVDPAAGGAPRAHRDALKLLAVFVQHTDSKPEQQRLICVGPRMHEDVIESCETTIMLAHDLGRTFGRANLFNRDSVGSANLAAWSHASVWTGSKGCVANMPRSQTGSLDNPIIADGGRKFLADLLVQLTDKQIADLFDVSRFPRRATVSDDSPDTTTVAQWVEAFKQKRNDVVNRVCPG